VTPPSRRLRGPVANQLATRALAAGDVASLPHVSGDALIDHGDALPLAYRE
jgi:hypothetical protein